MDIQWFHTILGTYNPKDRWMGIDYSKVLLDPLLAECVLFHETIHGLLVLQTDFGQFTFLTYKALNDLKNYSQEEKEKLRRIIYENQLFTQEGIATYIEIHHMSKIIGKREAYEWARNNLPKDYMNRLDKFSFAKELSSDYHDLFVNKIATLTMNTGVRQMAPKLNLLKNFESLREYFLEPDNNPDLRLTKILEALKYKPWMVTKSLEDIAKESKIKFYQPANKDEALNFLNYISNQTNNPITFGPESVTDAPIGKEAFLQIKKELIVGNMNMKFRTDEVLFKNEDFLFYKDKINYIFVAIPEDQIDYKFIKSISGENPEVSIAGFLSRGEKYLTLTSKEKAEDIINNDLKDATQLVKWGAYNVNTNNLIWSNLVRPPDIVLYNSPENMIEKFKNFISTNPHAKFLHLHVGAGENHPLQTILIKVIGINTIHLANDYGNSTIIELLKILTDKSTEMTKEEFNSDKKHINNAFNFWLNLHEDIDWVGTMIDKKNLIFKK